VIQKIRSSREFIESRTDIRPELGIILGTGLNSVTEKLEEMVSFDYSEIPGFKVSTAPSHRGRLLLGITGGKQVVIMQGRLHYYEGFSMQEITYPVRVMAALGIQTLVLTNAAGGLSPYLEPGDLVLIKDHLNLMGDNPLIGENYEELGERFPSLHDPYNASLRAQVTSIAARHGLKIKEGVYAAVMGPSMETRSECLMIRNLGADVVGMSTVPEVIVAIHSGLRVLALSAVTNMTNIFHIQPHSQLEIQENAGKIRDSIEIIIKELKLDH
jgi:purine-nucleoside phosphorylase